MHLTNHSRVPATNAGGTRKSRAPLNSFVECPLLLNFYIAEGPVVAGSGVDYKLVWRNP